MTVYSEYYNFGYLKLTS